jgi:SH3-like domain-containing protein
MTVPRLSALLLLLASPTFAQLPIPPVPPPVPPVVEAPGGAHAQRPMTTAPVAPAPPAPLPARPAVANVCVTGVPVPRWAALRSDEVNLRVGPGTRFPIDWQYHRRDLPVQILREVEVWRLVEDQDGIKGWVHQATLVGHRSFVVKGAEAVLRRAAGEDAEAVARLRPGVVGRIRACAAGAAWCEVRVGDYRGWLRRDQFWGTFPGEAVN